jgi:hypothetical protein
MAKRTPRSQANESAASHTENASIPPRPKARRSRSGSAPEDTIGAYPGVERSEEDGTIVRAVTATSVSRSMGSEPSDEDIRMRAYQRYLERGGDHGMDFEDWLAAERDLRASKV